MTALADIDSTALGADAAEALAIHVKTLAPRCSHRADYRPRATGGPHIMPLVSRLCLYAQIGERLDWDDSSAIGAALDLAAAVLLSSPARPWRSEDFASLAIGHGPAESDLLHVLGCVDARLRIERGEAVSVAELAALASITRQRAYQLARKGEIVATGGRGATASTVTAMEARRWLASRGLRGWGETPPQDAGR